VNTIGLDMHSASFTMALINEKGKLRSCLSRSTSEENLIEVVARVPGAKQLAVEESHMAQWVKGVIEPYVDRLVVCDPKENRWIARDEFIDDRRSAIKLAQLLREGHVKEVYHSTDPALRNLFLHYHDLNEQLVRFKNKLKAMFRQVAIETKGDGVYDPEQEDDWLKKLAPYPDLRFRARHLWSQVQALDAMKREALKTMRKRVGKTAAFRILQTFPGVGPVVALGYIAMIVTPHRFSRKNKLWRYAGFGNVYHNSDGVVYKNRPSRSGNRVLKWVVKQHLAAAVDRARKANRFQSQYGKLCSRGLSAKEARRHVCRALLSAVRAAWMKGEAYREFPANQTS